MVPLNTEFTVLDYIKANHYPVILVSSSKLGSINHTLLSIEALKNRNLDLLGIVYNRYPGADKNIATDSVKEIRKFMIQSGYKNRIIEMKKLIFQILMIWISLVFLTRYNSMISTNPQLHPDCLTCIIVHPHLLWDNRYLFCT